MSFDRLPVLSLSDPPSTRAAEALGDSFAEHGFAVVADHGVNAETADPAMARARAFFALPEAVKARYRIVGGGGQRGYTPFGVEAAKDADAVDLKEFWHIGRELPEDRAGRLMAANVWPDEIDGFRADTLALYVALDDLAGRILTHVALYLGLAPDFFVAPTRDGDSILRLLHYPPLAPHARGVRAAAHEDIDVITILLGAQEAGLQLLDRANRWIDVRPPEGAVVVNIGDMLQRLTNHVLPSTTHRVVNPGPDRAGLPRYSAPFFHHFAPEYLIETLAGCVGPDRPNRYPVPITAREYLNERLREIRLV